jgi:hypothetical protein
MWTLALVLVTAVMATALQLMSMQVQVARTYILAMWL